MSLAKEQIETLAKKPTRRTAVDVLFGPPAPLPPFFRHFGSKWLLAKKLPAPRYGRIVELFGGAGGYSCRWHDRDVTLIDIDPGTVSIWHYLQQASVGDIMALPGDLPREDVRTLGLSKPEVLLLQRWITHQGGRSNWKPTSAVLRAREGRAGHSSFWGAEIRARIAANVSKIRHWKIVLGSWLEHIDWNPATWIVDPPYQTNRYAHGRTYGEGGARGVDFALLGKVCRALRGQVIAHEQEGADWLPFEPWQTANTGRAVAGVRGERVEYLWTGGVV